METKYNLNITTSGENGDNATTTITTSDANKLSDLLKLAGMSQAHPVALNVSPEEHMMPDEEHDAPCSDCGGSPCGCGMTEGESWDNEPEEFVHSPEEVFKTGDDLHKVKKSYPPVAGGDNPMALEAAENKLRGMYAEFIAESEEEVVEESNELVSPWAKTETVNEGHGWMKGYSKYHCKECGCQMHDSKPDCDCKHDCHDESGSWWVDKDGNGVPDMMESAEQQAKEKNTMNLNDIRRLAGLKEQPELPRMTNDQYKELAGYINQIDPTYADYETRLHLNNLYDAIDDGDFGEITAKENQEFNDLINELDDLIVKAAKQQGVEVPTNFDYDGVNIPNDIQREMETVIAKMKAVFIDKRSWTV